MECSKLVFVSWLVRDRSLGHVDCQVNAAHFGQGLERNTPVYILNSHPFTASILQILHWWQERAAMADAGDRVVAARPATGRNEAETYVHCIPLVVLCFRLTVHSRLQFLRLREEAGNALVHFLSPGGRNPLFRHEALVGGDCVPEIFRYQRNLVDFV